MSNLRLGWDCCVATRGEFISILRDECMFDCEWLESY